MKWLADECFAYTDNAFVTSDVVAVAPEVTVPIIAVHVHDNQLLKQGEASAEFRPGIDPVQLYVTMVGFAYFHRSNAHTLSVIFKSDIHAPEWQAENKRYAREMTLRFLRHEPS